MTAVHRIGRDHWTVSGHYDIELVQTDGTWAIGAITLHSVIVLGDEALPQKAQVRARG